jgi:RNA polymerase sigma-B factor
VATTHPNDQRSAEEAGSPGPAGGPGTSTAGQSTVDAAPKVDARFARYRRSGDRRLRDELIEEHLWLARHCARRYAGRGEALEDLVQVAMVGLVKAVERFDADRGFVFSTFAVPTILGELRRHFRDAGWAAHVPRRMKETHLAAMRSAEALLQELGRAPTSLELAERMSVAVGDLAEAAVAAGSYRASSLHPVGEDNDTSDALVVYEDRDLDNAEARAAIERILEVLPRRERHVVELRYFSELSQREIASRIGISQVHVSRLLKASIERLRREFRDEDLVAACA